MKERKKTLSEILFNKKEKDLTKDEFKKVHNIRVNKYYHKMKSKWYEYQKKHRNKKLNSMSKDQLIRHKAELSLYAEYRRKIKNNNLSELAIRDGFKNYCLLHLDSRIKKLQNFYTKKEKINKILEDRKNIAAHNCGNVYINVMKMAKIKYKSIASIISSANSYEFVFNFNMNSTYVKGFNKILYKVLDNIEYKEDLHCTVKSKARSIVIKVSYDVNKIKQNIKRNL